MWSPLSRKHFACYIPCVYRCSDVCCSKQCEKISFRSHGIQSTSKYVINSLRMLEFNFQELHFGTYSLWTPQCYFEMWKHKLENVNKWRENEMLWLKIIFTYILIHTWRTQKHYSHEIWRAHFSSRYIVLYVYAFGLIYIFASEIKEQTIWT